MNISGPYRTLLTLPEVPTRYTHIKVNMYLIGGWIEGAPRELLHRLPDSQRPLMRSSSILMRQYGERLNFDVTI